MFQTHSKTARRIKIAIFLSACFLLSLYYLLPVGYFNINLFNYPADQVQINNISEETCLHVLKTQNYRCTVNNNVDKLPMTTSAPKPLTTAEKEEPDILVLIWMWPFGTSFEFGSCSSAFNIHGCRLTDDKGLFNQAHGVMFHHRDISWDLSNMPKLPRTTFQKWIWWNMESPTHSGQNPLLKDLFNLTSSYRRDSDIPVPYGWLSEATEEEKSYTIPKKSKLVCWIVSNYNPDYKRSHYFTELVKYINVETYGGHFSKRINNDEYVNLVSSCKFYLSFENSIHRDYITEKLFNPLNIGTVPVVIGPPRENYEQFIPSEAFIHVDDFPSPKELADHLRLLDQNEDLYMKYFSWREHFVSKSTLFGFEHVCRICDYIRKNKHYKVVRDLNSWYWG